MNVRQLIGTSVVLACVLAVYSSPIAAPEDESFDVETRGYDDFDWALQMRDLAYDYKYAMPEPYEVYGHERRAAPPRKTTQTKKPATRPVKKPKAPVRKPEPKKPAPKKPDTKTPSNQASPAKRPGSRVTRPIIGPPGQRGSSCNRGKGKRGVGTTCGDASLTLSGVTRELSKMPQKGNSGAMYRIIGGWPDPTTGKDVPAQARSGKTTLASEIKRLGKVDQLLAGGKFEGQQYIVFHPVGGDRTEITSTTYWTNLYKSYIARGNMQGCSEEVKETLIPKIVQGAKAYVDKYQILHTAVQPGNILWDQVGSNPTFINWGSAKEVPRWSAEVEKRVRDQAESSYLKGPGNICAGF